MVIKRDRRQENYDRYQTERDRFASTVDAANERRERRRAAEAAARQEAALQAQQAAEQARRDKQQQLYEQQTTAQRGLIASDLDAQNNAYRTKQNQLQQKGVLKRDQLQNQYETARERQKALDQQFRDQRQFGYSTLENEQQFGQQMQRDAAQHGYSTERDQLQHGNTLQRDALQFGLDTKRENQQQRNTLQRDVLQSGIQAQRDLRLNEFDALRDERQQGYTQQNMYRREAADITARWQEYVQEARNNGLEFSPKQQQKMKELDTAFRENVLNSRDLDEVTKQQALVEHQRKLSGIIPEERVRVPQQTFEQSIVRDPETGEKYLTIRDPKGFERFEPLSSGQDPMMKAQQQQAEKQAEATRKAEINRFDRWQKVLEKHTMMTDAEGNTVHKKPADALKAAMDEFALLEDHFRTNYGLKPLPAYQNEADEIRAKEEEKLRKQQKQPSSSPSRRQMLEGQNQAPVNPYSQPPAQSRQPAPVLSSTSPIPDQIGKQLRSMPGGEQLYKIREKHKSKSPLDQTVRLAADIVINALMTNDTSDPDFAQAQDILKRAGYTIGQ